MYVRFTPPDSKVGSWSNNQRPVCVAVFSGFRLGQDARWFKHAQDLPHVGWLHHAVGNLSVRYQGFGGIEASRFSLSYTDGIGFLRNLRSFVKISEEC